VASHIFALRDISAGEELTECYTSFHLPKWFIDLQKEYQVDFKFLGSTPLVPWTPELNVKCDTMPM